MEPFLQDFKQFKEAILKSLEREEEMQRELDSLKKKEKESREMIESLTAELQAKRELVYIQQANINRNQKIQHEKQDYSMKMAQLQKQISNMCATHRMELARKDEELKQVMEQHGKELIRISAEANESILREQVAIKPQLAEKEKQMYALREEMESQKQRNLWKISEISMKYEEKLKVQQEKFSKAMKEEKIKAQKEQEKFRQKLCEFRNYYENQMAGSSKEAKTLEVNKINEMKNQGSHFLNFLNSVEQQLNNSKSSGIPNAGSNGENDVAKDSEKNSDHQSASTSRIVDFGSDGEEFLVEVKSSKPRPKKPRAPNPKRKRLPTAVEKDYLKSYQE